MLNNPNKRKSLTLRVWDWGYLGTFFTSHYKAYESTMHPARVNVNVNGLVSQTGFLE